MRLYLESSALVKRYFDEPGTELMSELLAQSGTVCATSRVSQAQAVAAFTRRSRESGFDEIGCRQRIRRLDDDLGHMVIVDVTDRITDLCREIAIGHPLRGFDCIHLASALLVAGPHRDQWTFACSDVPLAAAAAAEGLRTIDPVRGSDLR